MYDNIHAELGRNRMTISELANKLNVSRSTASAWMNGKREIPAHAIIKMAKIFGCSTDYLLGIQPQKTA